jgi:hypothetical protein
MNGLLTSSLAGRARKGPAPVSTFVFLMPFKEISHLLLVEPRDSRLRVQRSRWKVGYRINTLHCLGINRAAVHSYITLSQAYQRKVECHSTVIIHSTFAEKLSSILSTKDIRTSKGLEAFR